MNLQKQFTKKVKEVDYHKWVIVIPPDIVKDLGWDKDWEKNHKAGKQIELEAISRNGKLVIEKK